MRKVLSLILAIVLVLSLAACQETTPETPFSDFEHGIVSDAVVTNARISKANDMAASARNTMTYFLQEEIIYYSRGMNKDAVTIIYLSSDVNGKFSLNFGIYLEDWVGYTDEDEIKTKIEEYYEEWFPDARDCVFFLVIIDNNAIAAAYWNDGGGDIIWDNANSRFIDGDVIISEGRAGGRIIGTSPVQY